MDRKNVAALAGHADVLLLHAVLRDQHGGLHQAAHAEAEHDHAQIEVWSLVVCSFMVDSRIMPATMPMPPMIGKIR